MILTTLTNFGFLALKQTKSQRYKLRSLHSRALDIINTNCQSRVIVPSPTQMIQKRSCKFVKDCLDGNVCDSFKRYFKIVHHCRSTRNNDNLIALPKLRLEYARSSFMFMGAKLFNDLPFEIRCEKDNEKFLNIDKELFF